MKCNVHNFNDKTSFEENIFGQNLYLVVQKSTGIDYFFVVLLLIKRLLLDSLYFCKKKKMNRLRYLVENQLFGVCSRLGEKLNFSASSVRLYFIYASFFTFGSPIILYLILAFWMEVRKHLRRHKNPTVWEF